MRPRRTSPAYVYMAQDEDGSIKIGCSVQPHVRIREVRDHRRRAPVLIEQFKVCDKAMAYRVEKAAHWLLREHFCRRQHFINEWFTASPTVVSECIKRAMRADRRAAKDYGDGRWTRMKWWHVIAVIHPGKGHKWIKGEMTVAYRSLTE